MASYTASNTPRACPAVTTGLWEAAEALPPTPNNATCENMVASATCVPADTVATDVDKIGTLFGTVCGMDSTACSGITGNASTGIYGDFIMCDPVQQLAYVLNQYYVNQKKTKTACDFGGQAKLVTPSGDFTFSSGTTNSSPGSTSGGNVTTDSSTTSSGTNSGSSSTSSSSAGRMTIVGLAGYVVGGAVALLSLI